MSCPEKAYLDLLGSRWDTSVMAKRTVVSRTRAAHIRQAGQGRIRGNIHMFEEGWSVQLGRMLRIIFNFDTARRNKAGLFFYLLR